MYKTVADNICTVIIERKHTLSLVRLYAGLPLKKGAADAASFNLPEKQNGIKNTAVRPPYFIGINSFIRARTLPYTTDSTHLSQR